VRITGWHVDAFGALQDVGVRDLPPGLVVIHGPNTAGKSTLLAFLQRTLFGYPHRNRQDVNHYEPVGGGTRGGRVHLVDTRDGHDTGEIVVERHDGRPPKVIRPDGSVAGQAALDELVHGADRRLFNAVFAFDLDDLSTIDSLTDEAVRDRLFSAGVRGAGRSARAVMEHLDGQARQVWTPRSRTQQLDRLQEEIDEVTRELDEALRAAASYPQRLAEEERWRDELEAVDDLRAEVEAEEQRADVLLRAWPVSERRQAAQQELAALGEVPELDVDVLEHHEGLRATIDTSRERLERLETEHEALSEQLEACHVDARLLEVADEVAGLEAERSAQLERIDRLQSLLAEHRRLSDEIERTTAALGTAWGKQRDAEPSSTIVTRGALRDWEARLAGADRALEAAERELQERARDRDHAARHVTEADEALTELEDDGALPSTEQIEHDRERLVQLRVALLQRDAAASHAATDGAPSPLTLGRFPLAPVLGVLAVLLAATGIVAAVQNATGLLAVLVGVAALLFVVALVTRQRERATAEADATRTEPAPSSLVETINARAAELGLPEGPTFEDAEQLTADLEEQRARRLRADQLGQARLQASERLADTQVSHGEALQARDHARDELEEVRGQWRAWCHDHALDGDLSPATVIDLLAEWERVAERRRQLDAIDGEVAQLRTTVEEFSTRAGALIDAAGGQREDQAASTPRDARDRLEQLHRLATDTHLARERADERARLCQRLGEVEAERTHEADRCQALEHERDRLLASAGAGDEAELREIVERARRRDRLQQRIDDAARDLADRLGADESSPALTDELARGDRDAWRARRDRAHRERRELQQQRDEVLAALLESRQQREAVETSQLVAELEQRRHALLAQRDDLVEQWQIARTARAVVADTLESFERERQPGVLRRAGEHLQQVTDGAYRGLLQQGEELLLQDAQQRTCTVDVLSRGTAEQLYLCLRLALAEDLSDRGQSLPFVMDDVLVNLDPERSHALAGLLGEVARTSQILYFTCHPQMVDLLQREADAAAYDLPRGGGEPVPRTGGQARVGGADHFAGRAENPQETWWP
jgi:uncharacterized protein YhaN